MSAVEVAAARRAQKGIDDVALAHEIELAGRRAALQTPPRPAPELARRIRSTAEDLGDLVEGNAEHVVQHERDALGGCQRSSTTMSAAPTDSASTASSSGSLASRRARPRAMLPDRILGSGVPGTQTVEAYTAHHGRQQPTDVLDLARDPFGAVATTSPARRLRPPPANRASDTRAPRDVAGSPRTPPSAGRHPSPPVHEYASTCCRAWRPRCDRLLGQNVHRVAPPGSRVANAVAARGVIR